MIPTKKNIPSTIWYIGLGVVILIGLVLLARWGSSGVSSGTTTVTKDDWVKGAPNSTVTLIEYSDFQCPACAAYYTLINEVMAAYGDQIQFVYRHFPLTQIHSNAMPAALAGEAAGKQGKFFEMHDILFEKQSDWSNESDPTAKFESYARTIGLNTVEWKKDMESSAVKKAVTDDMNVGLELGVNSTPSFFLNGTRTPNPRSFADFKELLENALKDAANDPLTSISTPVHIHADFAVYVNGKPIDFSVAKYQSDEPETGVTASPDTHALDPDVHLHNKNGNIIHLHKTGVTLGQFFSSLGMTLTNNCLKTDDGKNYCDDASHTLKMFVNGVRSDKYDQYLVKDLDRILISYGSLTDKDIPNQIVAITEDACIYSEKCLERGPAPKEECVGGIGTDCTQ